MKVRYELVDEHEKCPAEQKTYYRRQKTQRAVCFFCTLDRRNEQRPHGRRHHDSRSKPQKQSIEFAGHLSLEEKYERRARSRRYENDTKNRVRSLPSSSNLPSFRAVTSFPTNSLECASIYAPALFLGQKQAVRRIDKLDLLISRTLSAFSQTPAYRRNRLRRHDVVNGERAALFQHAQRLRKKSLPILALDVVIDIVARHGVERFVRKVEFYGVSPRKNDTFRTPSASALRSQSGRLNEAYSLPQRSMPTICARGLRFAQAMVSAPLPQPTSSPSPSVRQCNVLSQCLRSPVSRPAYVCRDTKRRNTYLQISPSGRQTAKTPRQRERRARCAVRPSVATPAMPNTAHTARQTAAMPPRRNNNPLGTQFL